MKITDGKKIVCIELKTWGQGGWSPDLSLDLFEAGALPYDEESDSFIVSDVDYCIEQAEDWEHRRGDFSEDSEGCDPDERRVFVDVLG